ncbi:MAG: hypothetical protein EPN74_02075 [Rhodanobacter sp.]|nr:MAG: hypothetical protein EPN74_02075 [Rhodanobacter sp.]
MRSTIEPGRLGADIGGVMRVFITTSGVCCLCYGVLLLAALFSLPQSASFSALLREAHSPLLTGAAWLLGLGLSLWRRTGRDRRLDA